jgi:hypothetical protein
MIYGLQAGAVVLTEAGKKIAARNAARLKAAITAMQEMLAEVEDGEEVDATEAGRELAEAMLRKSDTLDARMDAIRRAVRETMADPMRPDAMPYVWIRDLFDASVVIENGEDGGLMQYPYSIDTTVDPPRYIIGEGSPVQLAYVPMAGALTEAALDEDFVALNEGAVRSDGTATIKLITPGHGSSGYYPKEVLERDGPKVFLEGTKMYADHPTAAEEAGRPERSIRDLAAVLTTAGRWQDMGPDGPGLYAEAKVYEAWRKPLDEMAADTGVSIRALGRARMGEVDGRKGPIVESIVSVKSVDFVTDAGRGGRIVPLAEAARNRTPQGRSPISGSKPAKEVHMPLSAEEQAMIATLQESVTTLTGQVQNLATQNTRLVEAAALSEAGTYAAQLLAGVNLPQMVKDRVAQAVQSQATLKEGALDREAFRALVEATAKTEANYLASVTGYGHVRLPGGDLDLFEADKVPTATEAEASLTEAFQALGMTAEAAKIAAKR